MTKKSNTKPLITLQKCSHCGESCKRSSGTKAESYCSACSADRRKKAAKALGAKPLTDEDLKKRYIY